MIASTHGAATLLRLTGESGVWTCGSDASGDLADWSETGFENDGNSRKSGASVSRGPASVASAATPHDERLAWCLLRSEIPPQFSVGREEPIPDGLGDAGEVDLSEHRHDERPERVEHQITDRIVEAVLG